MKGLLAVVMLLMSGCSNLLPLQSELAQSGLKIPSQWSQQKVLSSVPQPWLADFEAPLLEALIREAVDTNFDLQSAAARLRMARAQADIVAADQGLQLGATGAASRRGAPTGRGRLTENSFDASLSAVWETDIWGTLAHRTRAAVLDARASEKNLAAARLSLAANVARAWFDAVESRQQVELARHTAQNFSENLRIVEQAYRRGLGSALDVRLERANVAGAQAQLAARQVSDDATLRVLEVLLGRYPRAELELVVQLPALKRRVPAGLPAEILQRRPDIRAAAFRLAASDERFNAARKNRLPDISLSGAGGLSSNELRSLLDFNSLLWNIAANLTAPIFQGGRLSAARELARSESGAALNDYAQVVLVAFREVETALAAEDLLDGQEQALHNEARELDAAVELALKRYRSGLIDLITWLEARRRAFQAHSALLAIQNQRLQNRVALYLALGGEFTPANDMATHMQTAKPSLHPGKQP